MTIFRQLTPKAIWFWPGEDDSMYDSDQLLQTRRSGFLRLSAILWLMIVSAAVTQAQTLKTLYNFTGGADGAQPFSTLVEDRHGKLYGTAWSGGIQNPNCIVNGIGCGTLFELTPSTSGVGWSFNVLYSFRGYPDDGSNPDAESLVFDRQGNIYGTTVFGGDLLDCDNDGCGILFKLTPDGTETVLHNFHEAAADAIMPFSGVIIGRNGSLFGATFHGGTYRTGTVYEVTSSGTEKVLYNFTQQGTDGEEPFGALVLDKHGNLYGTTQYGGANQGCASGCGTVFRLAPDGTETVLYSFAGGADGFWPYAGLTMDKKGNLYGTTWVGGGSGCGGLGCGTVFKLAPDGTETVLHSFSALDGAGPHAGVILDAKGNLYGTTSYGGSDCTGPGCGVVFKLAPDGTETVLHRFDYSDGAYPYGGVVLSKKGSLYGTTQAGGANNQGTIFELTLGTGK
jgi:uncharacterized repeat protein (TIGR03803 family)